MTKIIMLKGNAKTLAAWCKENDLRLGTACARWKNLFGARKSISLIEADTLLKDRRTKLAKRDYCSKDSV